MRDMYYFLIRERGKIISRIFQNSQEQQKYCNLFQSLHGITMGYYELDTKTGIQMYGNRLNAEDSCGIDNEVL